MLRGQSVTLSPQRKSTLLEAARTSPDAQPLPSCWSVTMEGRPVALKWLVSQLSGVPRGEFHTDEARRVARQLGLEVTRR